MPNNPSTKSGLGNLFGRLIDKQTQPSQKQQPTTEASINYSLFNVEAAEWAIRNTGATYSDISLEECESIGQAVSSFVRTRGFTVGKVKKLLSKYFDEERAELIAITEITRAYAHAAQIEGEKMKMEFPDVKVVKTWTTNNDDQVRPVCSLLDGREVGIFEHFSDGIFIPPAHAGCRCWIASSTALGE